MTRWGVLVAAALLAASGLWAQPSRVGCGPAQAGCGPAVVLGVTTTTAAPQVLPIAGNADAFCPTTVPASTGNTPFPNTLIVAKTCATGANAHGYDVTTFYAYIAASAAGNHVQCSVWTVPGGYTTGTAIPKVAASCDSAAWISTSNPNAYIAMTVAGPCHLAPATRYFIGCNSETAINQGYVTPCGGGTCAEENTSTLYPGLGDPWTANGTAGGAMAYYLLVSPTP